MALAAPLPPAFPIPQYLCDPTMSGSFPAEVEEEPPKDHLLKRVLSHGSSGSTPASASLGTPTSSHAPLSPASGGARTPRAKKVALVEPEPERIEDVPRLADGMDGLKVRSPIAANGQLPSGIQQTLELQQKQTELQKRPERQYSSSTESSNSAHPVPPSHLGSSYGSEGFPLPDPMDDKSPPNTVDIHYNAQAAAAVAAADEAIKQLNGTTTVFQGPPTPGLTQVENPFSLPRGYANFVNPQARATGEPRSPMEAIHRQSSTSSTATEASTSSEESDLCVPSIEWVNTNAPVHPASPPSGWFSPVFQQPTKVGARSSPGRMPPPAMTGRGSPRRTSASLPAPRPTVPHQPSLPLGATAHTPSGLRGSALPGGINPDQPNEEDDDDATVGHGGRARSPSGSSQSAQSGLDLLWHAATQAPESGIADPAYDGKGKRKAGAEAVAQWRTSGIPIGEGARVADGKAKASTGGNAQSGAPRKRRRSELAMEAIDPALRDAGHESAMLASDEEDSREVVSDDDGEGSAEGSEYGGGGGNGVKKRGRGRPAGVKKAAGGAGTKRSSTSAAAAGATSAGTPNKANGSAGGAPKKARKSEGSPSGNGGGGGGGGKGGGGGDGRRGSGGAIGPNGVQCEYVNPLPPYNRCQDVFTRKYDLPRHMARHARREGELVYEGKLSEDKALLWKTIKDKPKVTCQQCGESFTRMDALKRHQTKQHHS